MCLLIRSPGTRMKPIIEALPGLRTYRRTPRHPLPAADRDLRIPWLNLDGSHPSPDLLSGQDGCAGTYERVEHHRAGSRDVFQSVCNQLQRLHGWMSGEVR